MYNSEDRFVHDLKNHLSVMMGYLEIIEMEPGLSEQQKRYILLATDAAESVLKMVNDLQDKEKEGGGLCKIKKY